MEIGKVRYSPFEESIEEERRSNVLIIITTMMMTMVQADIWQDSVRENSRRSGSLELKFKFKMEQWENPR